MNFSQQFLRFSLIFFIGGIFAVIQAEPAEVPFKKDESTTLQATQKKLKQHLPNFVTEQPMLSAGGAVGVVLVLLYLKSRHTPIPEVSLEKKNISSKQHDVQNLEKSEKKDRSKIENEQNGARQSMMNQPVQARSRVQNPPRVPNPPANRPLHPPQNLPARLENSENGPRTNILNDEASSWQSILDRAELSRNSILEIARNNKNYIQDSEKSFRESISREEDFARQWMVGVESRQKKILRDNALAAPARLEQEEGRVRKDIKDSAFNGASQINYDFIQLISLAKDKQRERNNFESDYLSGRRKIEHEAELASIKLFGQAERELIENKLKSLDVEHKRNLVEADLKVRHNSERVKFETEESDARRKILSLDDDCEYDAREKIVQQFSEEKNSLEEKKKLSVKLPGTTS